MNRVERPAPHPKSRVRARALATRTTTLSAKGQAGAAMPKAGAKEIKQVTVARKMCDAVAPKTAAEQFREDRLIGQLWREDGRKNQIQFVVFQLRQLIDKEGTDRVVVNAVGSADIVNDLG